MLDDGLLNQWGTSNTIPTSRYIPFSISFPSEVFSIVLTHYDTGATTNYQDTVAEKSRYGVIVLSESPDNDSQFVIVIGI